MKEILNRNVMILFLNRELGLIVREISSVGCAAKDGQLQVHCIYFQIATNPVHSNLKCWLSSNHGFLYKLCYLQYVI